MPCFELKHCVEMASFNPKNIYPILTYFLRSTKLITLTSCDFRLAEGPESTLSMLAFVNPSSIYLVYLSICLEVFLTLVNDLSR